MAQSNRETAAEQRLLRQIAGHCAAIAVVQPVQSARVAFGKYLKAKYLAIEWLDSEPEAERIEDLTERIRRLAVETDVRHLPDYAPISATRLAQPLDEFQRIKRDFRPGEGLLITLGKDEYSVDLKSDWIPSEHIEERLLACCFRKLQSRTAQSKP